MSVPHPDNLADYRERLSRLNVNVRDGRASPHKVCMLLAVLDLAMAGGLTENLIRYAPPLLERYRRYFDAVRREGDHANPHFPFFHLKGALRRGGESFWHLVPLPGREQAAQALASARSDGDIVRNFAGARLDDALFALVQQAEAAQALAQWLAERWFDRGLQELGRMAQRGMAAARYERAIRTGLTLAAAEPVPEYVRSPAFRRVVIELYDYRCAATGHRVLLEGGEAMVEAAHIHPFAETGDDDPRNGIALTPDMHWAMDRNLIAPGPDLRWHVSAALDDRVPDLQRLVGLKGRALLLPEQRAMWPREAALAWRLARLRDPGWRPPMPD
ncbi:HNH endonuclease [Ideonella sp. DXS22W]|uniref:HNH endonuclease n=1 Tax=Pseudaquabacterium inlustre TaxID=2984192 RepID=A0ABU9CJ46_9BURK